MQAISTIRKKLNVNNVLKGFIILHNDEIGFYSPDYGFLSNQWYYYRYLTDWGYPIRCAERLIMNGEEYIFDFNLNDGRYMKQIDEIFENFKNNITSDVETKLFIKELENVREDVYKLCDMVNHAENKKIDQTIDIKKSKFVKMLNELIIKLQNMYNVTKEHIEIIEKLNVVHASVENGSYSFDSNNYDNFVWLLVLENEKIFLNILNDTEQIKKRCNEIRYNSTDEGTFIPSHVTISMVGFHTRWSFHKKYMEFVKNNDRESLKKLFEFIVKINDKEYSDPIYNCKVYRYDYLIQIMDDDKKAILIKSMKELTNKTHIIDASKIETLANYLGEAELKKVCQKIYKRRRTGDLDKNNHPRPIISIHYKGNAINDYKNNPDFINLSEGELNCLMSRCTIHEKHNKTYYRTDGKVFTLSTIPNYIFKTFKLDDKDKFKSRCKNQIFARELIKFYNFDMLIVPKFGFVQFDKTGIIYEEMIDVSPAQDLQKEYYKTYANKMSTAIEQFVKFCCMTGLDDVVWRNIPLYNPSLNEDNVKIVLVDLAEMKSWDNSIFGGADNRLGLIKCADLSLFDTIKDTFFEMVDDSTYYTERFASARSIRVKETQVNEDLENYFKSKNISKDNKYQHIELNKDELKFDDYSESNQELLKDLCEDLVDSINNYLDNLSHGTINYTMDKSKNNIYAQMTKDNPLNSYISLENERTVNITDELKHHSHERSFNDLHAYHVSSYSQKHVIDSIDSISRTDDEKKDYIIVIALQELARLKVIFKIDSRKRHIIVV